MKDELFWKTIKNNAIRKDSFVFSTINSPELFEDVFLEIQDIENEKIKNKVFLFLSLFNEKIFQQYSVNQSLLPFLFIKNAVDVGISNPQSEKPILEFASKRYRIGFNFGQGDDDSFFIICKDVYDTKKWAVVSQSLKNEQYEKVISMVTEYVFDES